MVYTSFRGDLISQLTSIKQGEVVVALGRGRGFIMMVGKWNWLFSLVCGIWTFLIITWPTISDRFWNTRRYSLLEELGSHQAEPPWETCRNHQFHGRVIVPHEFAITPIRLMKTTLQNRHLLHALNYQLVITHKQHANVLTSGHCEVHRKRAASDKTAGMRRGGTQFKQGLWQRQRPLRVNNIFGLRQGYDWSLMTLHTPQIVLVEMLLKVFNSTVGYDSHTVTGHVWESHVSMQELKKQEAGNKKWKWPALSTPHYLITTLTVELLCHAMRVQYYHYPSVHLLRAVARMKKS